MDPTKGERPARRTVAEVLDGQDATHPAAIALRNRVKADFLEALVERKLSTARVDSIADELAATVKGAME